ncbi:MAG: chitobiase/beta-hexosaminidase C-terminal domain-containing protein [Bacteroidales bacterium]|jgi:exo-beta-1,3-glucanase (GH17 family)|nr:chitobiase/beta-hexosaminidase C-terminal domain-containing protein [Bacteroidales bacterium]
MKTLFFNAIVCILSVILLCADLGKIQAAEPEIMIHYIPPIGTGGNAEGKVVWEELSSNASQYAVIAMLRIGNGYVKPYYTDYLSPINAQGDFSIDITTGGIGDYNVADVSFYFVLRSTFAGIAGENVTISYMNNPDRYICSVTINRNVFWEDRLQPPIPSIAPGFVLSGTMITLSCQSGETIYYTVDGSDPTLPTAQTYTPESVFTVPNTGSLLVKAVTKLSGLYSSTASFVWLPKEPLDKPFFGLNASLALNGEYFGYPLSETATRTRMQAIAPLTSWIRTFGTLNNGQQYINQIAKDELGLHTLIGIYITNDANNNNAQIQGLQNILDMEGSAPDMIAVGNECSLLGVSSATLSTCVDAVREVLNERNLVIPVGTVDVMGASFSQSLLDKLDFIGVNIYSGTWDATPDNEMLTALSQNYANTVASFPSKLVLLTETGTPYAGGEYTVSGGTKTPSEAKASSYLCGFLDYIHNTNVPSFYFEAYDEPIKSSQNGGHPIEQYFGLMNGAGTIHSFYQDCINSYITQTTIPYNRREELILYPNPVSGLVHIDGMHNGSTIRIVDTSGKIVKIWLIGQISG